MATPLYKRGKIKTGFTTSPLESYYGSVKARERREAEAATSQAEYEAGTKSYEEYTQDLSRLFGRAVGLTEKAGVTTAGIEAQEREYSVSDTDYANQFTRGELSYEEYRNYLTNTLGRYEAESAQYTERESDIAELDLSQTLRSIDEALSEFNLGRTSYSELSSTLSQYQSQFGTGSDYYNQIEDYLSDAQQTQAARDYQSLGEQYSRGEITYRQYQEGLQTAIGTLYGSSAFDNIYIGDQTVSSIIQDIESDFYSAEDTNYYERYTAGQITFKEYATYLQDRLGAYTEGTDQYSDLSTAWKSAYQTQLGRFYQEMSDKYSAGTITADEWSDFNSWYSEQVQLGGVETTEFPTYTYGAEEEEAPTTETPTTPSEPELKVGIPELITTPAPASESLFTPRNWEGVEPTANMRNMSEAEVKNALGTTQRDLERAREEGKDKLVAQLKERKKKLQKTLYYFGRG